MEELGIGRPSTYAAILQVLQDRGYVRIDKKRLILRTRAAWSSASSRASSRATSNTISPRNLEEQLDRVANNEIDWKQGAAGFLGRFHRRGQRHTLELRTADGKVGMTFAATEAAGLTKTRWVATGVNNGKGAVSSVVAGTTLTAIFAEAGTVAGSGGCNDYNGPYTSDASTIKIGPLAATRMACTSPAGVDEQETQFFAAMERATRYTIAGSKLELRDDGGALQVSFRATLGGG